jgi:hypothetical protein
LDSDALDAYTGNNEISSWLKKYLLSADNPNNKSWSSQWVYSMAKHFSFTVVPPRNLVQNIGFLGEGTNSMSSRWNLYSSIMAEDVDEFIPPAFFFPNRSLDTLRFELIKKTDPIFSWSSKFKRIFKKTIPYSVLNVVRNLKNKVN